MDGFDFKVLVRTLLMPPALPWMMSLVGLLMIAWSGRRFKVSFDFDRHQKPTKTHRRGLSLLALGLLLGYFSSIGAVADLLALRLEQGLTRWEPAQSEVMENSPQAVVILGGGSVKDGASAAGRERLKQATLQRVVEGARIARITGLPVLVSGGVPQGLKHAEAHLMRDTLRENFGVPVRWVEDHSRDTADNARMSAAMLREEGVARVILVTQAYHMPRAERAFAAAGLRVTPAPHGFMGSRPGGWALRDFLPSAQEAELIALCLHEWTGRLWYAMRGYF